MSGPSIEAPYSIASLPTPFDRKQGQIYSAPVHSVRGSKKRKRHEIAVGIDGEVVNVYNVESQNLITSYALPPQTYLCSPPASIYRKAAPAVNAQRKTFVVAKDGLTGSKRRLICFTESVKSRKKDAEFVAPTKTQCDLKQSDVLSLDTIPGSAADRLSVIVSYKNGGVEIIDSELSNAHHEPVLKRDGQAEYQVESADILNFETASKGILKGREDIVAQLNSIHAGKANSHLLCRLVRTKKERILELYTLHDPTQSPVRTSQGVLQLVTTYALPVKSDGRTGSARYELHSAPGTLYQLLHGRLSIFDLSGTIPKLSTTFGSNATPIQSFTRVSSNSVLTFSNDTATLSEATFGATQASISLASLSAPGVAGEKRKRSQNEEQAVYFKITAAFTHTGLVVGVWGQKLLALSLQNMRSTARSARASATLLRDVNVFAYAHGTQSQPGDQAEVQKWQEWTAKIDALVGADDIESLERLIADVRVPLRQGKTMNGKKRNHLSNGGDIGKEHETVLTFHDSAPQYLESQKAQYLLSKVFKLNGNEKDPIEIQIPSYTLLECLAFSGVLSASYLRNALKWNDESRSTPIQPGDIMTAISKVDRDFQLMHDLLSLPSHWEVGEVVQALRLVIQSFDSPSPQEAMLALPAPSQPNGDLTNGDLTDGDVDMANGDTDSEIELESKALENELDIVMHTLNNGLETRSNTLHVITQRLGNFPQKTVTSLMRSMMSSHEIVFFIHILRIELADGGWTSQYVDIVEEDEDDEPTGLVPTLSSEEEVAANDQAILAIGDLLNCAVDAIGTTGWLVGLSSSALGTDGLIENLKAEIGAGLEGCYEANTLNTLLRELEVRLQSQRGTRNHKEVRAMEQSGVLDEEMALLPLGSRGGDGGGVEEGRKKKTKYEVAQRRSRKIGKYAFERIRI